jgi:hypothetical protein
MIHNTGITTDASDEAALAVDRAQAVWMTLNEARARAFTGEIIFETDPEVLAYLDNGVVYYAERVSDVPLGRRLLEAGVIDIEQLERGTVRVGDLEHLGRLFDRDPSIDRDAVIVVAEASTDELIADLANRAITTARVTAYRHHPSGVHRWFVAPLDPAAVMRPVSAVAQLDSTVVDQLPGLGFTDEFVIEWDEDIDAITDTDLSATESFPLDGFDQMVISDEMVTTDEADEDVVELSLDLAEFTDEVGDDSVETFETFEDDTDTEMSGTDDDEFEFSVVWPDGSHEPATEATAYVEDAPVTTGDVAGDVAQGAPQAATFEPEFIQADDGHLEFTMPPLTLSDEPEAADAEVPDDVADAVRRAIAAIESASVVAPIDEPAPIDEFVPMGDAAPVGTAALEPTGQVAVTPTDTPADQAPGTSTPSAPAALGAFAPPTMATRAEVLYGMVEDDSVAVEADVAVPTLSESPAGGVASVVFVDDPEDESSGGGNERSSALRRLIGSLRRKDH